MTAFVTRGTLDDAKNFIARVIALPEDGDGYIGIHNTFIPKGFKGGKLPFGRGLLAADENDAVQKLPRLFTGNNRDIYVCMGTQKRYLEAPNRKTGEIQYVPDKHRENIYKLKSLFLDIDFKGGKHGYVSQEAADTALKKFLADSGLPNPSVVVHTGGGYHVYWVFLRALTTEEWQVYANQLEEATRVHGLKHDGQVTIDASRVLRIPNTLNYKYDPPRSVKIHVWSDDNYDPDELAKVLSQYQTTNITPKLLLGGEWEVFKGQKPFQGFQSTEEITELGAGCTVSPPIDLKQVYPNCGFIRNALATGGANLVGNPMWNLTTLLSVFTKQGRGAAHLMSEQNQYYNKEQTDKLFDRKELERQRGVGWPKCATIKAMGATECDACPHFAKGMHPFNFLSSPEAPLSTFARTPLDAPESPVGWPNQTRADILPDGFQRNAEGLIFRVATDDDGNNFHLFPTRTSILSDAYFSLNPGVLHFMSRASIFTEPVKVNMPLRYILNQGKDMGEVLGDAGISVENKKHMGEFLMAWVDKLRESRDTITEHSPFGWADTAKGITGFAYAGKLYTPDGVFIAKEADAELAKQYSPRGDISEWKKAAKMVTDTKRPAMDAILAAAFAAPLVYFTGEEGLYFGTYSEDSGVGKTTTMRIAQSVWGAPGAVQRLTDTIASVQEKMGALRHLPIAWDELKGDENLREMARMIFDLTSGRSKSRLTSSIQQRGTVSWKTLLITASNNSMADYLNELAKNNDAGFYRLFELRVDPIVFGSVDLAKAAFIKLALESNYGIVGEQYAQFLGQKFNLVRSLVNNQQTKLQAEFQVAQAERNWLNVAVVLIVGATLANTLGFTEIDVPALKARLYEEIVTMRGILSETPLKLTDREEIVGLFIQYMRENARSMVITNDIWQGQGRPPAGTISIVYPITNIPTNGLTGQFGEASRVLRIAKRPLDNWLRQNKIPAIVFKRALEKFFKVQHLQKKALGTGLPGLYGMQEVVLDFDCSQQDELGALVTSAIRSTNVVAFQKP